LTAGAVSQLLWPDKDREVWFSLGENHEKDLPLRSTPIAKRLAAIHGARPRFNAAAIAGAAQVFADPGSPEIMARTAPETLVREKAKEVR
jgi:hypothetical protein